MSGFSPNLIPSIKTVSAFAIWFDLHIVDMVMFMNFVDNRVIMVFFFFFYHLGLIMNEMSFEVKFSVTCSGLVLLNPVGSDQAVQPLGWFFLNQDL